MMRIFGIWLALFLFVALPVCGEELSFNDFLSTALTNSYQLRISKINTQIAKKGVKEARAGYLPTVSAFATTERYNDLTDGKSQLTAVGNDIFLNRSYYQDMAAVGLSYNVFDFGVRKKQLEIAKADDKQKEIVLLKDTKDLKLEAVEIYAQALSLYKQAKIKSSMLKLEKELLDIQKRLRTAGEASEIDVVDSEIKVSELKSELDEINNNLAKKLTEVSYYTQKPYDMNNLQIKDFPPEPENITADADGIVRLAAEVTTLVPEYSPEVRAYDLEIFKKSKEYEIQKKANFPKLRFDTRYNLYGSDPSNLLNGIGDISQRSYSIRLSTSFVLFDGLKNINTIAKSKMEVEKLKIEKEKQIAELKKKYAQIQLDSKNALVQSENNSKTLALVDKNLGMLERLNTNGIVDKSNCIKKQLDLLDKKLNLEENQIKIFTAHYKLQVLKQEEVQL